MGNSYASTYVWSGAGDGTTWSDPGNWTYYDGSGNAAPYPLIWINGVQVPEPPGTGSNWATVAFPDTTADATPTLVTLQGQDYPGLNSLTLGTNANVTIEKGTFQSGVVSVPASGVLTVSGAGTVLSNSTSATVDGTLVMTGGATVTLNSSIAGTARFGDAPENSHNTLRLSNSSLSVHTIENYTPADSIVVLGSSYPTVRWIQLNDSHSYALVPVDGSGWTQNAIVSTVTFAPKRDAQGAIIKDTDGNTVYYSPADLAPAPTATGTIDGEHGDGSYTGHVYYQNAGLTYDAAQQIVTVTCFLAGSLIRTEAGDVPVEDVYVGDRILTVTDGVENYKPVIWAGYQTMTVQQGLPDDEAGCPVRVRAGALAAGVPYQDLLITPEHCLLIDGQFVPVRMLVNGGTIAYDRSLTRYTYYHVETACHDVIMANGTLTESYLDTGNRGSFAQTGSVVTLGAERRTWAQHSAAPLAVEREAVEPIFHALMARAVAQASPDVSPRPELTADADLHLETMDGKVIRKIREQNGRASFMLPADVAQVRLLSRASRPSDVIGPFVDDRRMLGVLVGDILVQDGTLAPRRVMPHPETGSLPGWHAASPGDARWTNGHALLPLPAAQPRALRILTLHILSAGPYLRQTETALPQNRANG